MIARRGRTGAPRQRNPRCPRMRGVWYFPHSAFSAGALRRAKISVAVLLCARPPITHHTFPEAMDRRAVNADKSNARTFPQERSEPLCSMAYRFSLPGGARKAHRLIGRRRETPRQSPGHGRSAILQAPLIVAKARTRPDFARFDGECGTSRTVSQDRDTHAQLARPKRELCAPLNSRFPSNVARTKVIALQN